MDEPPPFGTALHQAMEQLTKTARICLMCDVLKTEENKQEVCPLRKNSSRNHVWVTPETHLD